MWFAITTVDDDGWTTTINAHGQVEWTPPLHPDTGEARVDDDHHPEGMLNHNDEDEDDEPNQEPEPYASSVRT